MILLEYFTFSFNLGLGQTNPTFHRTAYNQTNTTLRPTFLEFRDLYDVNRRPLYSNYL